MMSSISNFDTYELISAARLGEQVAFERLREMYTPLIASQVSKRVLPEMNEQDAEDMRQEALIVFCKAVLSYDLDRREVEFGLYAKICIEHGLSSFVRSFYNGERARVVPLDEGNGKSFSASDGGDMLQRVVAREQLRELVGIIDRSLSELERRVWWLYASGMTASQISRELGNVEPRAVSNAIYRIRKKLRDRLGSQNNV